jgi:peptidoglycan-N-acetylglucosamine deacetylase
MIRPLATVNVDVDPVDLHLLGYGVPGLAPDPLVYDVALPRLLDRCARAGVRATFFCVGRDAVTHAAALGRIVAVGHEVASHSLTHPLALTRLPAVALRSEIAESKRLLERAIDCEVAGFRAPNFDVDDRVLGEVAAAGYRYDASGYPTPLLAVERVVLALKGGDPVNVLRMRLVPHSLERAPHRHGAPGGLAEFPASVTPLARWPVYHTLRLLDGPGPTHRRIEGFARRGEPLSYALHAVDVLGLAEDGVDPRFASHPGMRLPLADKLSALDQVLGLITGRFEVTTFQDRLARGDPP